MAALDPLSSILNFAGSSLGFANNLVLNAREKNAAQYATEMQKLQQDFALTQAQIAERQLQLTAQFNAEQAKIKEKERADNLHLVLVGFTGLTLLVLIVLTAKREKLI